MEGVWILTRPEGNAIALREFTRMDVILEDREIAFSWILVPERNLFQRKVDCKILDAWTDVFEFDGSQVDQWFFVLRFRSSQWPRVFHIGQTETLDVEIYSSCVRTYTENQSELYEYSEFVGSMRIEQIIMDNEGNVDLTLKSSPFSRYEGKLKSSIQEIPWKKYGF